MGHTIKPDDINKIVWKACDTFRGAVDPSEYKNYILTMLFIKYMSDLWQDKRDAYEEKFNGDKIRIDRALSRERFVIPEVELKDGKGKRTDGFQATFQCLFERREAANIGELINITLTAIEDANKSKLENVFRSIDFNSEPALGQTKERNKRLKHLLENFSYPRLDLRPSRIGNRDIIGDVYEYMISQFAAGAGKKAENSIRRPKSRRFLQSLCPRTQATASAIRRVVPAPCSSRSATKSPMATMLFTARNPTAQPGPSAA